VIGVLRDGKRAGANCGIYAFLRVLEDMGERVKPEEYVALSVSRHKRGMTIADLQENIAPDGVYISGPLNVRLDKIQKMCIGGSRLLARIDGGEGEAHLVYLKRVHTDGLLIAEDNLHNADFAIPFRELDSIYEVLDLRRL
jgi:hypothetical protein